MQFIRNSLCALQDNSSTGVVQLGVQNESDFYGLPKSITEIWEHDMTSLRQGPMRQETRQSDDETGRNKPTDYLNDFRW